MEEGCKEGQIKGENMHNDPEKSQLVKKENKKMEEQIKQKIGNQQ